MKIKNVLILVIIALAFLLCFSVTTSPLYNFCSSDSALFALMGQAFLDGKILYKDIFDHKGPILFFIEALGQFVIPGRLGIFIFQLINLTFILFFVQKMASFFVANKQAWIIILVSLIFLFNPFGGGNLTEEYSLLFLIVPLYLVIRDFKQVTPVYPLKYTFIYGLCFTLIAFIRISNAAPLAGIILTVIVFLIREGKWKSLLMHSLVFILAIIVVTVPICIYFYSKDALYDMFYGTFIFNMKYAGNSVNFDFRYALVFLFGFAVVLFAVFNSYIYYKNTKNARILLLICLMSVLSLIAVNMGMIYLHYQVILLPLLALAVAITITNWQNKNSYKLQKYAIILSLIIFIIPFLYFTRNTLISAYSNCKFGMSVFNYPEFTIPEEEKSNVLAYNLDSGWYLYQKVLPSYKYFTNQDFWIAMNPGILDEFNEVMRKNPPCWVIIRPDYMGNKELEIILNTQYEINTNNNTYTVYRLLK